MLYIQPPEDIDYPTSDGEPMGETDLHRDLMMEVNGALQLHFEAQPDIYTSGNILMFYEEGNRNAHISPDALIALGVPQGARENYKIWEEGKAPDLVIEITSKSTKLRDVGFKKGLYEALGVREYLLFDPRNEYLKPRFQVYRLEADLYVRVLASESSGYLSQTTGLVFRVVDDKLRIFDAAGALLPTPREHAARAKREAARADREAARAEQEAARAEQEAARAEQEAARADREAARAEQAAARAKQDGARAEHEAARADALERELAALKAAKLDTDS